MFCPKLLKRAAVYNFFRDTEGSITRIEEQETADRLKRNYGVSVKLPCCMSTCVGGENVADFLNNVELGRYSKLRLESELSPVYCKLGEFSSYTLTGWPTDGIFPRRVASIIGRDFCKVSVNISSYNKYYENKYVDSEKYPYKNRVETDVTGLALQGDSFAVHLEISRGSIYMSLNVFTGDLEVYHLGELVATCPPGYRYNGSLLKDGRWKWDMRKGIKECLRRLKEEADGRL